MPIRQRHFWACLGLLLAASAAPAATRTPCDDTAYEAFVKLYDYDATAPLNAKIIESSDMGGTTVEKFEFDSVNGQRVPGYLVLPPNAGKRPLILVLHGLGGSKDDLLRAAPMLAMFGVEHAFLALDAEYHGDRQKIGTELIGADLNVARQGFIQTVLDYRRAIDYVSERDDIDLERIGVGGMSMGAMMGTILTAVEPRIKAAALVVGGADWPTMALESKAPAMVKLREEHPEIDWANSGEILDPIDPLHFAGHFRDIPVLLINARADEVIPLVCAEALQNGVLVEQTTREWYDTGHLIPAESAALRLLSWFQENL